MKVYKYEPHSLPSEGRPVTGGQDSKITFMAPATDWKFVSQIRILNSNHQCDRIRRWFVFGRRLAQERGALRNGKSVLIEETFPASPTRWGHREMMAIDEQESGLSLDTLISNFSASRNVRIKHFCCYKPRSVWYFFIAAHTGCASTGALGNLPHWV